MDIIPHREDSGVGNIPFTPLFFTLFPLISSFHVFLNSVHNVEKSLDDGLVSMDFHGFLNNLGEEFEESIRWTNNDDQTDLICNSSSLENHEHENEDKKHDKFEYIMDAKMSDIPKDGVISKLLIFRNNPLNLENMTITKKQGTLGSILVIGNDSQQYGNFTDFKSVPGLESIAPASKSVQHKMNNVILRGLGNNTDDKDINALTLVNLSNNHQFNNISVLESEDDGVEIFGGSVNMSNITVADAKDDYFDTDHGHSGTISNLKLSQSSNWRGKSLIECGNKKGSTTTKFTNLTHE